MIFDQVTRCPQPHELIMHRTGECAEAVQFVHVDVGETFNNDAAQGRVQLCLERICHRGLFVRYQPTARRRSAKHLHTVTQERGFNSLQRFRNGRWNRIVPAFPIFCRARIKARLDRELRLSQSGQRPCCLQLAAGDEVGLISSVVMICYPVHRIRSWLPIHATRVLHHGSCDATGAGGAATPSRRTRPKLIGYPTRAPRGCRIGPQRMWRRSCNWICAACACRPASVRRDMVGRRVLDEEI